jgi:GT2 family glycosyltransferase
VLLLNSDTIVPAGAIDALVAELQAHPEAAVIGPRLVGEDGRLEISFGRMIGPVTEFFQKVQGRLYDNDVRLVQRRVERAAARGREVDWVSGACLLVRRADALAAGLLDERFFLYTEDVDFCASVRALGRTVRFTPHVQVIHVRGRSRRHNPSAALAAYRRSQLAFYAKHHPWWAPLRLYLTVRGYRPMDQ